MAVPGPKVDAHRTVNRVAAALTDYLQNTESKPETAIDDITVILNSYWQTKKIEDTKNGTTMGTDKR